MVITSLYVYQGWSVLTGDHYMPQINTNIPPPPPPPYSHDNNTLYRPLLIINRSDHQITYQQKQYNEPM